MPTTYQTVLSESPEFPKLLRKLVKQDSWRAFASDGTKWDLKLKRTIKGATGEPDEEVEVQTDIHVGLSGRFGSVQSFHDSKPVEVRKPAGLHLSETDVATLAQLLTKFPKLRLTIRCSGGSTSSSEYGLSFYSLEAADYGSRFSVELGGGSVCNGKPICVGSISF
jgi:hypothetical protein